MFDTFEIKGICSPNMNIRTYVFFICQMLIVGTALLAVKILPENKNGR